MGKIMRVYLCGQDWTESHEEMYMNLPATPWELVDALEKLNLVSEGDLYLQAEEYYDFDYIQGFIPESTSLSSLNELCAVLDGMDEQDRIGFRGLLQSSAFFDHFNLGFDRLMDLALAKDCYSKQTPSLAHSVAPPSKIKTARPLHASSTTSAFRCAGF